MASIRGRELECPFVSQRDLQRFRTVGRRRMESLRRRRVGPLSTITFRQHDCRRRTKSMTQDHYQNRSIRLLFVIDGLTVGGAQRMLLRLLPKLSHAFDVELCSIMPKAAMSQQFEARNVVVHYLDIDHASQVIRATRRFSRLIQHTRPDAILSFLQKASYLGRVVGRVHRVRHHVYCVRTAYRALWKHTLLEWVTKWLVDKYVCNSYVTCHDFARSLFLPSQKVAYLPNCVTEFHPPRHPQSIRSFCTAATLAENKDYATLIRGFALIAERNRDATLAIFGDGPEREKIVSLISELGISGKVRMHGAVHNLVQRLPEYDCFLFASKIEGMSNAVMEAGALGLPIVCSDIPPNREMLADTAYYFPVGDHVALAEAFFACQNAVERKYPYKRILERYSLDATVRTFIDILRTLPGIVVPEAPGAVHQRKQLSED
ncbi:MAG: glycosyltransferase [Chitinivibrionales bacterium]|nr:glycosyltransferase [Chitinivibrionales bacterium]